MTGVVMSWEKRENVTFYESKQIAISENLLPYASRLLLPGFANAQSPSGFPRLARGWGNSEPCCLLHRGFVGLKTNSETFVELP